MERNLIFSTLHGSHLYGLSHEGSDEDWYEVYEGPGTNLKQTIEGKHDVVRGDLTAFLTRASSGAHQSAEALFSKQKDWAPGMEDKWGPFLNGFRLGGEAFLKYERTIRKFAHSEDFKKRRHSVRLAYNLWEMKVSGGRFDPRIHPTYQTLATGFAGALQGEDLLRELEDLIHPSGFDKRKDL